MTEKQSTKYSDPWEHLILEQTYDDSLFELMQHELTAAVRKLASKPITIINDLSQFDHTLRCIQSNPIDETYIRLFSTHRQYTSLKTRHQVIVCVGDAMYRIHDEAPSKVLSAVSYVWSNNGSGTLIYNHDKEFVKEVEWKENRTLIFCGETDKTWHTYYCKPNAIRITLNTFLVQT